MVRSRGLRRVPPSDRDARVRHLGIAASQRRPEWRQRPITSASQDAGRWDIQIRAGPQKSAEEGQVSVKHKNSTPHVRRFRERQQKGQLLCKIAVDEMEREALVEARLLKEWDTEDSAAVAAAVANQLDMI